MITKEEAEAMRDTFYAGLSERISTFLRNRAQSGQVGGTLSWSVEPSAEVEKVVAELDAAGWAVSKDDGGKTLTIAPK